MDISAPTSYRLLSLYHLAVASAGVIKRGRSTLGNEWILLQFITRKKCIASPTHAAAVAQMRAGMEGGGLCGLADILYSSKEPWIKACKGTQRSWRGT